MKPHDPMQRGPRDGTAGANGADHHPMQGEGNKDAAREYNREAHEFVADGKVADAARHAKDFVDRDPAAAERAERAAMRGPASAPSMVDDLLARGRAAIARARPMVEHAIATVRTRLGRK